MYYLFSSVPEVIEKFFNENGYEYKLVNKHNFDEFLRTYKAEEGDIGIVCDFGKMIPKSLLEKLLLLNIHFSLLPKYRGAIPVEAALLNGDSETGITVQRMAEKMDAGDILVSKRVDIDPNFSAGELQAYLYSLVPSILNAILPLQNRPVFTPQQGVPSYCYISTMKRENAEIKPEEMTSAEILNKIRAFNPEPYAWLKIFKKNGQETTINLLRAEIYKEHELINWTEKLLFIKKRGLLLKTKDGGILVTELIVAGQKALKNGDIVALKGQFHL